MQMQGYEAMWQLVLDAHLHCVYPGRPEGGFVVCISGASRSGKSCLAKSLTMRVCEALGFSRVERLDQR